MNVTEDILREYISVFHSCLSETAEQFLPPDIRKELLHLALLPARVIGYVSTQFGTAIEYIPSDETVIEIQRGSGRVEDMLVHAPSWFSRTPPVIVVMATGFSFIGEFILRGPIRLGIDSADASINNIKFAARNWEHHVHYAELWGTRHAEHWSREKAVLRAKDEVLAALAESRRAEERQISIDEYIKIYKQKTVLLLGDYGDSGMTRLEAIRNSLKGLGYDPLLVKEVPDYPDQDLSQKVVALGAIARFVVVDDSSKSGHVLEIEVCKQNRWVTVLLRAEGHHGSWMTAAASAPTKVILEKSYSPDAPNAAISEATEWAESILKELQTTLDNTYPWRKKSN